MHRYHRLYFIMFLLLPSLVKAQGYPFGPGLSDQGVFVGGLGYTVIDGESYFTFNFRPEIAIGKIGVGLDIPLRYSTDTGKLRHEDWNEGYDYLRAIRYARYGHKRDPFYTRVGALDATRIGHGFIMNFYNNEVIEYDRRKVGLVLDVDAGIAGFESMTSNLGRAEIFGGRVYYRPLYNTQTPIIRNFAIGGSYVTDIDPDRQRHTDDPFSEFGMDVELPIIKTSMLQTLLYADFAKISGFGSGKAAGIEFTLQGVAGVFDFTAQLERRFLGKEFLPSFFNAFYEIDRYRVVNGAVFRKDSSLASITGTTRGTFGLLYGSILNTVSVLGTFERLDKTKNSGLLHLEASVPDAVPKITAHASYDRTGIDTFRDAFKFDDRSVARAGLGYKIYPFLVFFMDYIWTYQYDESQNRYKIQKRFEPQIAFVYPFSVGGK